MKNRVETILKISANKDKIIDTYKDKITCVKHLNISMFSFTRIINNNTLYKDHYYIKLSECPSNLLENYDGLINKSYGNAKKILAINQFTNEKIIFNSLNEIVYKFGGKSTTSLTKAIKNKTLYMNYYWKFYDEVVGEL
jgi:hypothetical protein